MKQKFIIRYVILTAILLICASAAWYWSNRSEQPAANAVLARAAAEMPDGVPASVPGQEDFCILD